MQTSRTRNKIRQSLSTREYSDYLWMLHVLREGTTVSKLNYRGTLYSYLFNRAFDAWESLILKWDFSHEELLGYWNLMERLEWANTDRYIFYITLLSWARAHRALRIRRNPKLFPYIQNPSEVRSIVHDKVRGD